MLSTKENRLLKILADRQSETDGKDDAFYTMIMTLHPHDTDSEYYLDGAIDYAEKNPKASLKDIRNHLIEMRPEAKDITE